MSSGLGVQNWPGTQLVWGAAGSLFWRAHLGLIGSKPNNNNNNNNRSRGHVKKILPSWFSDFFSNVYVLRMKAKKAGNGFLVFTTKLPF